MLLIILATLLTQNQSCQLSGKQIGRCSNNPLFESNFCQQYSQGYICIPAHNITWSQYDASYRDGQIQGIVLNNLQDQLIRQYGQSTSTLQISNNRVCYEAYKQFICQWNFPYCDPVTNSSMKMCESICNNFQTACGGTVDACSIIYAQRDLGLNPNC